MSVIGPDPSGPLGVPVAVRVPWGEQKVRWGAGQVVEEGGSGPLQHVVVALVVVVVSLEVQVRAVIGRGDQR